MSQGGPFSRVGLLLPRRSTGVAQGGESFALTVSEKKRQQKFLNAKPNDETPTRQQAREKHARRRLLISTVAHSTHEEPGESEPKGEPKKPRGGADRVLGVASI